MLASAGERDKLVTIQAGTPGTAGSGIPTITWNPTALAQVWMAKREVSGSERLAAAQLSASVDSEWEMPYQANMDPELVDVPKTRRLLYKGRKYDITRAILMERAEGQGIKIVTKAQSGI